MSYRSWVTGPLIDLVISSPKDPAKKLDLVGIVDTGASVVCLDSRIADELGLKDTGRTRLQLADGTEIDATIYAARVSVPALDFNNLIQVVGAPMPTRNTRVLIGRSFLKPYVVNYNGPSEQFTFHLYAPPMSEDPESY